MITAGCRAGGRRVPDGWSFRSTLFDRGCRTWRPARGYGTSASSTGASRSGTERSRSAGRIHQRAADAASRLTPLGRWEVGPSYRDGFRRLGLHSGLRRQHRRPFSASRHRPPAGTSCSARSRSLGIRPLSRLEELDCCSKQHTAQLSGRSSLRATLAGNALTSPQLAFVRAALAASLRARRISAAIWRRSARCWREYLTTSKKSARPTTASSRRSRASSSGSSAIGEFVARLCDVAVRLRDRSSMGLEQGS